MANNKMCIAKLLRRQQHMPSTVLPPSSAVRARPQSSSDHTPPPQSRTLRKRIYRRLLDWLPTIPSKHRSRRHRKAEHRASRINSRRRYQAARRTRKQAARRIHEQHALSDTHPLYVAAVATPKSAPVSIKSAATYFSDDQFGPPLRNLLRYHEVARLKALRDAHADQVRNPMVFMGKSKYDSDDSKGFYDGTGLWRPFLPVSQQGPQRYLNNNYSQPQQQAQPAPRQSQAYTMQDAIARASAQQQQQYAPAPQLQQYAPAPQLQQYQPPQHSSASRGSNYSSGDPQVYYDQFPPPSQQQPRIPGQYSQSQQQAQPAPRQSQAYTMQDAIALASAQQQQQYQPPQHSSASHGQHLTLPASHTYRPRIPGLESVTFGQAPKWIRLTITPSAEWTDQKFPEGKAKETDKNWPVGYPAKFNYTVKHAVPGLGADDNPLRKVIAVDDHVKVVNGDEGDGHVTVKYASGTGFWKGKIPLDKGLIDIGTHAKIGEPWLFLEGGRAVRPLEITYLEADDKLSALARASFQAWRQEKDRFVGSAPLLEQQFVKSVDLENIVTQGVKGVRAAGLFKLLSSGLPFSSGEIVRNGINIIPTTGKSEQGGLRGVYYLELSDFPPGHYLHGKKVGKVGKTDRTTPGEPQIGGFPYRFAEHSANKEPDSRHGKIWAAAKTHRMVPLVITTDRHVQAAWEQLGTSMLETYDPAVLGARPGQGLNIQHGITASMVDARILSDIMSAIKQELSWAGLTTPVHGLNWLSPLFESEFRKSIWLKQSVPGQISTYSRTSGAFAQTQDSNSSLKVQLTMPGSRLISGTKQSNLWPETLALTVKLGAKASPSIGTRACGTFEITDDGQPHPNRYFPLPLHGRWSNWSEALQIAYRVTWEVDGVTYGQYLEYIGGAAYNSAAPDPIRMYASATAMKRYLERRAVAFSPEDTVNFQFGNLPDIWEGQFQFLKQCHYLRQTSKRSGVPTPFRKTDAVMQQEMKALGLRPTALDDFGDCDRCAFVDAVFSGCKRERGQEICCSLCQKFDSLCTTTARLDRMQDVRQHLERPSPIGRSIFCLEKVGNFVFQL